MVICHTQSQALSLRNVRVINWVPFSTSPLRGAVFSFDPEPSRAVSPPPPAMSLPKVHQSQSWLEGLLPGSTIEAAPLYNSPGLHCTLNSQTKLLGYNTPTTAVYLFPTALACITALNDHNYNLLGFEHRTVYLPIVPRLGQPSPQFSWLFF